MLQATFDKKPANAAARKKAKFEDRLPVVDTPVAADLETVSAKTEEAVAIELVPDIPAPVKPRKAIVPVKVATADEPVTEASADTSPLLSGWAVQIASADTETSAWSTWKKMQSRHKVLKSKSPSVVKADLGAKGVFYRVRLGGFEEQAAAKQACAKLKAGGVSCYISKAGS